MATRKNNRIANVIANEVKGENTMSKKNSTKKSVNANANVKGDVAMAIAKEIVKKNIANAQKGETTMTMTANINTNTKLNGYEIRFSVAPSAEFRKMLGRAEKGEDKRKKHYNFRFYQHLNNAWIIKRDNITDSSLKTLKSKIAKLGYEITETTDGDSPKARKGRKPVVKQTAPKKTVEDTTLEVKTATIPKEADLVSYLTSLGYIIELPEQKKESKPKAKKSNSKKATAKKSSAKKADSEKKAEPKAKKSTSKESFNKVEAEMPF